MTIEFEKYIATLKEKHDIDIEYSYLLERFKVWQDNKFCSICVDNSDLTFFISSSGKWMNEMEAIEYAKELIKLSKICKKLNQLICKP